MEFVLFALLAAVTIVLAFVVRQNYVLIQQRDNVTDTLTREHRMRHGCKGSIMIMWTGKIVHNRMSEWENEGLGSGRS